jgi:hypothetical protein
MKSNLVHGRAEPCLTTAGRAELMQLELLRQRSPTKKPTPSEEFETHESEYRQSKSVLSWSEIQDIERSNYAGERNPRTSG